MLPLDKAYNLNENWFENALGGQWRTLHTLLSLSRLLPWQLAPPLAGDGLSQYRTRCLTLVPVPQVLLQVVKSPQVCHAPHTPSSV